MSKHWPGFKVLCIVLLLGFGNGALGFINPNNLKTIVNYITDYGPRNVQYAVTVRLDAKDCRDPSRANLQNALPKNVMEAMQRAIDKKDGIYEPNPIGNVIAARAKGEGRRIQHAEWRLLRGHQNSLTAKLLRNKNDSCLIIFTKFAPCTSGCVTLKDAKVFVKRINPIFSKINKDSKAFVFEAASGMDGEKEPQAIVDAMKTVKDAPLFRCNGRECIQCFDNRNMLNPKCLAKM